MFFVSRIDFGPISSYSKYLYTMHNCASNEQQQNRYINPAPPKTTQKLCLHTLRHAISPQNLHYLHTVKKNARVSGLYTHSVLIGFISFLKPHLITYLQFMIRRIWASLLHIFHWREIPYISSHMHIDQSRRRHFNTHAPMLVLFLISMIAIDTHTIINQ